MRVTSVGAEMRLEAITWIFHVVLDEPATQGDADSLRNTLATICNDMDVEMTDDVNAQLDGNSITLTIITAGNVTDHQAVKSELRSRLAVS